MSWIFGPVPSRRFGRSLGIDLFSQKSCTLDCVYCEVGPTPRTTSETGRFAPVAEVVAELEEFLAEHHDDLPDAITFAGSGEPTLHREIDRIVEEIHARATVPVVLLTNGTLLHRPEVLDRVLEVDVLVPSLDAGTPETFRRVNRPHPAISFEQLTEGLLAARSRYPGQYLLEVLLVEGINTGEAELEALRQWVERISPDAVQINTVYRPGAEPEAEAASDATLQRFASMLGGLAQPVKRYQRSGRAHRIRGPLLRQVICNTLAIRPCTEAELADSLGVSPVSLREAVEALLVEGRVRRRQYRGEVHILQNFSSSGH